MEWNEIIHKTQIWCLKINRMHWNSYHKMHSWLQNYRDISPSYISKYTKTKRFLSSKQKNNTRSSNTHRNIRMNNLSKMWGIYFHTYRTCGCQWLLGCWLWIIPWGQFAMRAGFHEEVPQNVFIFLVFNLTGKIINELHVQTVWHMDRLPQGSSLDVSVYILSIFDLAEEIIR